MAASRNISIYQGDTYVHQLSVRDSSNTAINITSRTYSGQIRKRRSSDDVTANFASEITDGANGVVIFSLTPEQTSDLKSGKYVYDFQEVNGLVVTTLVTGNVIVTGEVTR